MRLPHWLLAAGLLAPAAHAADAPHWVAAWTGSAQGPYPIGNPTAQPELGAALPTPAANDQSFRLIVRPDVWGRAARLRLSNAFGNKPVTFDGVRVGLQSSGGTLVPATNRAVTFAGQDRITVPAGAIVTSDPVALEWVSNPADPMLANRKLAVSLHVAGPTGSLTWHAKGLTTSYLSGPHTGAHGDEDGQDAFPFSTTSWFFLDELDMDAPGASTVVAFGDSITDGTASTLNGDDRWPDDLSRRVHARFGGRFSVVNAGIGGNMVSGPPNYDDKPFAGGRSAVERVGSDVIGLPGVTHVIWLEGINDFGTGGYTPDAVAASVRQTVGRLRETIPGVKVFMGTLTSSLGSTNGGYGAPAIDAKRRAFNDFVRSAGIFDGVVDFDAATIDEATGALKPEFQPNSTTGGPGDKLHPNRAGYAAMARAVDLDATFGR